MASNKKPLVKVSDLKKSVAGVAPKKKETVVVASSKSISGRVAAAEKVTSPARKVAAPAKVSKAELASPASNAVAKKSAPSKSQPSAASKGSTVNVKAATTAGKTVKTAAPAKNTAVKQKPVAEVIIKPAKKAAAVIPAQLKDALPKKETKAQQRETQKRAAAALQRVQAKVAAAQPKPQPKPAPMPTVVPGREEKKNAVVIAHRRLETKPKPIADTSVTMLSYQPEYTRSILGGDDKDTGPTYRYSDEELVEFRHLIQGRLETARKELAYQQGLITHRDATGAEDTDNRFMSIEDGSGAMEREQLSQLASRQIQFINHLEKAMIRIENKTYGICRVTGKLIDKARLRAVPHATLSIDAKNGMNKK